MLKKQWFNPGKNWSSKLLKSVGNFFGGHPVQQDMCTRLRVKHRVWWPTSGSMRAFWWTYPLFFTASLQVVNMIASTAPDFIAQQFICDLKNAFLRLCRPLERHEWPKTSDRPASYRTNSCCCRSYCRSPCRRSSSRVSPPLVTELAIFLIYTVATVTVTVIIGKLVFKVGYRCLWPHGHFWRWMLWLRLRHHHQGGENEEDGLCRG